MTEHLTDQILEQYRRRMIAVADLIAADDHLEGCDLCRRKLNEAQSLKKAASFFNSEFDDVLAAHLSYEQISGFLDRQLTPSERRQIEEHLSACALCRDEVEELRQFDTQMAMYPQKVYAPSPPASALEKFFKPIGLVNISEKLRHGNWLFSWPALASAAAVLLVAAILLLLYRAADKKKNDENLARGNGGQSVTPSPVVSPSINPTPAPTIEINSLLAGLTDIPIQVKSALANGRVTIPPEMNGLTTGGGVLMGSGDKTESFKLISPVGVVINNERPTFSWQPFAGAKEYKVEVFTTDYEPVAESGAITATRWTVAKPLPRAKTYTWQVTAVTEDKSVLVPKNTDPPAKFKLLDQTKANELARAATAYSKNHLVMGVFYAEAGLLDDAERELKSLVSSHPDDPTAKRLLANLRAQRAALQKSQR